jgi:hypothetical protein
MLPECLELGKADARIPIGRELFTSGTVRNFLNLGYLLARLRCIVRWE